MAKWVDARDLKSWGGFPPCGFDSHSGHCLDLVDRSGGFQPPTAGAATCSRRFGDWRWWGNACSTTVIVVRQEDRTGDWKDRRSCRRKWGQECPRVERRLLAADRGSGDLQSPVRRLALVVERLPDHGHRCEMGRPDRRLERSPLLPEEEGTGMSPSGAAAFQPPTAGAATCSRRFGDCRWWGNACPTTVIVVRWEDRTGDWKDRRSCRRKRGTGMSPLQWSGGFQSPTAGAATCSRRFGDCRCWWNACLDHGQRCEIGRPDRRLERSPLLPEEVGTGRSPSGAAAFQPPTAGAATCSRRFGDWRWWGNACSTTVIVVRWEDRTGDWKDRRSCRRKWGREGLRVERRLSSRRPRERRLAVAGSEIAAGGGTPAWTTVNVVRWEDRTGDWKDRRSCRRKRGTGRSPSGAAAFQPPTAGAATCSRRFGDCRCWWNACSTTVNVVRWEDRTGDWKDRRSCRRKWGQECPRVERRLSSRRPRERRLAVAGSEIGAGGGTPARPRSSL